MEENSSLKKKKTSSVVISLFSASIFINVMSFYPAKGRDVFITICKVGSLTYIVPCLMPATPKDSILHRVGGGRVSLFATLSSLCVMFLAGILCGSPSLPDIRRYLLN